MLGYSLAFGSENQIIVNVEARETNSQVYDWNADETAFIGAGTVNIYDGLTVSAPTNLSVTNDTFFNADGTFAENLLVNWTTSQSAFIDHYIVEYKVATDANYFAQQTNAPPFVINNVRNSTTYDIRVKAVNELNVSSSFASTQHTSIADTTAPSAPTNLQVNATFKSINIIWTNPTDADFSHVEIHRASGAIGGTYAKVGESSGTLFVDTNLAFGSDFNYKVRAVDFSGNFSNFTSQNNIASSATRIESDEITSLSVQKLTGDVTEVYPFSQYYNTTLTALDSTSTIGTFTLPTPTLSITKRQKIDITALFEVQNSGQTAEAKRNIFFSVQKKSKGVNALQIGATNAVVSESFPHNLMQLISVSGNYLETIDSSGGVAKTNNASGSNEPATINSVYYDSVSNKTFVLIGGLFTFSTNDTLFYSDSKFSSAGTWVSPSATEAITVITPPDPDINYVNATTVSSGVGKSRFYLPFQQSYGQTNSETNYRVRCKVSTLDSGITYKIIRAKGTLENIS